MAHSAAPSSAPAAITPLSLSALAPWAAFAAVVTLVLLYFVGIEQGATAVFQGEGVHEWLHDGRHLLGFPCH
ncbi:CbtB domain-containing protein [Streptomyces sp. NPDC048606]|uniref:CbtB domain-containing protein n=1 Tax=Streptomyces sp. NPDC048606 TaxID=3154726 RepID=UPI003437CEF0